MKIQKLFIVGLLLLGSAVTFSQSYSLKEAIDYALVNHNEIKRNAIDRTDAEWQVKEFWSRGLPQVNANIGYQYFFEIPVGIFSIEDPVTMETTTTEVQFGTKNDFTAGLSATALLFDGGFLVGLKAQRAYKELIESQIGQTERDIRVNVTKAYLNVLALNESESIIQENIKSITKTRNETNALYENGFAEQLDVDRMELTLMNLDAELENLSEIIKSTKVVLKFQMGYPMLEDIELTDDVNKIQIAKPVDVKKDLSNWTYESRVEFGLMDQAIGLTDIKVRAIKAQYLPTLTASANYSQALLTDKLFDKNNSWFPTGVVGVNMAIPIYDAKGKKSQMERAKLEREELLLQRDDLKRAVDMEIATSQITLDNAKRSMGRRKASQALSEKIYDTTLIKYKEGVGSSLEVNQAEIDMLAAQRNYIDALFNYLIARTDLERALGQL